MDLGQVASAAPVTPGLTVKPILRLSPAKCQAIAAGFVSHTARARAQLGNADVGVPIARLQACVLKEAGCGRIRCKAMGVPFGILASGRAQDVNFDALGRSPGRPRLFSDSELKAFSQDIYPLACFFEMVVADLLDCILKQITDGKTVTDLLEDAVTNLLEDAATNLLGDTVADWLEDAVTG